MNHWGKEQLKAKNLEEVERKSLERYKFAQKYCKNAGVLDAASGCGYGSYILSKVARTVLGIDRSKNVIEFAQKHWIAPNISYRQFDLNSDLISLGKFDVIVSLETIEHLKTPILETCKKFYQLLFSGDLLILSHPEKEENPYRKGFRRLLKEFLGLSKKIKPKTFHQHFNFDGEKLKSQLVKMGFKVRDEWYQSPRFSYYYHLLVLEKK